MTFLRVFFFGFMMFLAAVALSAVRFSNSVQADISNNLVRLHILANSDAPSDQARKFTVMNALSEVVGAWMQDAEDVDEAMRIIFGRLDEIERIAAEASGTVAVASIERGFFPSRVYNDIALPAGEYSALTVILGGGAGVNWWCVLFPPLCFVDAVAYTGGALSGTLTPEAYALVTGGQNVRFRFRVVDMWQDMRNFFR